VTAYFNFKRKVHGIGIAKCKAFWADDLWAGHTKYNTYIAAARSPSISQTSITTQRLHP